MDRDARREAAKTEGRIAAAIGPAIPLQIISGVAGGGCGSYVGCLGVWTWFAMSQGWDDSSVRVSVFALVYTGICLAQVVTGVLLARRFAEFRKHRTDAATLARACGLCAAASGSHLVLAGVTLVWGVIEDTAAGGLAAEHAVGTALPLLLFEALPVVALVLTLRARHRVNQLADAGESNPPK